MERPSRFEGNSGTAGSKKGKASGEGKKEEKKAWSFIKNDGVSRKVGMHACWDYIEAAVKKGTLKAGEVPPDTFWFETWKNLAAHREKKECGKYCRE